MLTKSQAPLLQPFIDRFFNRPEQSEQGILFAWGEIISISIPVGTDRLTMAAAYSLVCESEK